MTKHRERENSRPTREARVDSLDSEPATPQSPPSEGSMFEAATEYAHLYPGWRAGDAPPAKGKAGMLWKKSGGKTGLSPRRSNWNKRWFRLEGPILRYYESEEDAGGGKAAWEGHLGEAKVNPQTGVLSCGSGYDAKAERDVLEVHFNDRVLRMGTESSKGQSLDEYSKEEEKKGLKLWEWSICRHHAYYTKSEAGRYQRQDPSTVTKKLPLPPGHPDADVSTPRGRNQSQPRGRNGSHTARGDQDVNVSAAVAAALASAATTSPSHEQHLSPRESSSPHSPHTKQKHHRERKSRHPRGQMDPAVLAALASAADGEHVAKTPRMQESSTHQKMGNDARMESGDLRQEVVSTEKFHSRSPVQEEEKSIVEGSGGGANTNLCISNGEPGMNRGIRRAISGKNRVERRGRLREGVIGAEDGSHSMALS